MSIAKILFSFEGRINRKTYWAFYLPFLLLCVLIRESSQPEILYALFTIIVFWPALAVQVKRWHDRNKSGFWVLINLIPILGQIWATFELGFLPGTDGENRFDHPEITAFDKSTLLCSMCDFSVKIEDFKKNELFCPECGTQLEVQY